MKTRGEVVQAELTGDYWQTVAQVHDRVALAGYYWSMEVTRRVLNALVWREVAAKEVRKGQVSSRVPGCPVERNVQMFRLKGDGGS